MRYFLFLSFVFLKTSVQGQEIQYFPQEEIVLLDCNGKNDKSDCLYDALEKEVFEFIKNNKKIIEYAKKDTLRTAGRIILDSNGKIDSDKSSFRIRAKDVNRKLKRNFKDILGKLKIKEVINRKSSSILTVHLLDYNYVITKEGDDLTFDLIPNDIKYTGGIIEEAPKFPGCEGLTGYEARDCFKEKIQAHIAHHFKYPKIAQKQRISGKVYVIFKISKTGEVGDIRTRGPHPILENKAKRIINLLPNVIPGKQNGEEVIVPLSIPINFRLKEKTPRLLPGRSTTN